MAEFGRIAIIGGGSTGWMAAAYLSQALPESHITLIESPTIPTIGVGESTNVITSVFQASLGIPEPAFLRACNGSYKIAIRFNDFRRKGHVYYHPFGAPANSSVKFRPHAASYYPATHLSNANRIDRRLVPHYGYQLDAQLYGEFLRDYSGKRGVVHVQETISRVEQFEDGRLRSVNGREFDFFIDCTGFKAMLLAETLREPFNDLSDHLPNDSAVVLQQPYRDKPGELEPFTSCTALSNGWMWTIPLWTRRSFGYVFSSVFCSKDEAISEALRTLNLPQDLGDEFAHVRFRVGRYRRPWVKNCLALGLAAGFIEPLESTGIALTQKCLMDFVHYKNNPARYNEHVINMFDNTVDFIVAHFCLSERRDTEYWRHVTSGKTKTDSLAAILSSAAQERYEFHRDGKDNFYTDTNWNCILSEMGLFDRPDTSPVQMLLQNSSQPHFEVLNSLHQPNEINEGSVSAIHH